MYVVQSCVYKSLPVPALLTFHYVSKFLISLDSLVLAFYFYTCISFSLVVPTWPVANLVSSTGELYLPHPQGSTSSNNAYGFIAPHRSCPMHT